MDVPRRGTNLRSRFFFLFLWPSHKSPYLFEDPSCAFGAALLQGPTQLACWAFSCPMRQFLNAFPLREGGGQRPGWMCLAEAQICAADLFRKVRGAILRLRRTPSLWGCSLGTVQHWLLHRFEDLSCAFGAALLQGPTQLARWTFSRPMRQFLNAFPLREGGGQRPGWMCLAEAQICAADLFRKVRGAILRLRRGPSLWGCSLGTVQH